jgi:hypothetical protein
VSKRWRIVIAVVAAVLLVIIGGFFLVLRLTAPSPLDSTIDVEPKELPTAWIVEDDPAEEPAMPVASPSEDMPPEPASPPVSYTTTGTLAFVSKGKPFGEESYEIVMDAEGTRLASQGRFFFRVVVATISVIFEQELTANANLHPATYSASFDAPLGQDQTIESAFADGVMTVRSNGEEVRSEAPEDAFLLGMFSTYALLPIAFPLRAEGGLARFDILFFGGPPGQSGSDRGSSPMRMSRLADVVILVGTQTLTVNAYAISSTLGDSLLLAKDREFLALLAGTEDEAFFVYRSDFFPDGFKIEEGLTGSMGWIRHVP